MYLLKRTTIILSNLFFNNSINTHFSTDALMEFTNGEFAVTGANATAGIFASYPAKHLSVLNGFVDQVRLESFFI